MSVYSTCGYACPACREPYLPFAPGVGCPRCGATAGCVMPEFVDETAAILEFVWHAHGAWLPGPLRQNTLGDYYLWLLFGALARADLMAADLDAEAQRAADGIQWGLKPYLRPHFAELFRHLFPVARRVAGLG